MTLMEVGKELAVAERLELEAYNEATSRDHYCAVIAAKTHEFLLDVHTRSRAMSAKDPLKQQQPQAGCSTDMQNKSQVFTASGVGLPALNEALALCQAHAMMTQRGSCLKASLAKAMIKKDLVSCTDDEFAASVCQMDPSTLTIERCHASQANDMKILREVSTVI